MGMSYTALRECRDRNGLPCVVKAGRNNGSLFAWLQGGRKGDWQPFDPRDTSYELDVEQIDPDDTAYDLPDEELLDLLAEHIEKSECTAWSQPASIVNIIAAAHNLVPRSRGDRK